MRHSGLQREVLSLYRELLRFARKHEAETRRRMEEIISAEFRKNLAISKAEFQRIEYHLSKGRKQLEMLKSSNVSNISMVTPK